MLGLGASIGSVIGIIFRVIMIGVCVIIMPFGVGLAFFHKGEFDRGLIFIFGMLICFAGFEVLYLPFFFLGLSFSLLTAVYFILAAIGVLAGFLLWGKYKPRYIKSKAPLTKTEKASLIVFALIAIYQILRVTIGASTWNTDDFWYLTIGEMALRYDTILRNDIITGEAFNYAQHIFENIEYVFTPWPLYWTMFSKLFGFTITIMLRTIMPGFFIAIFYYVAYRLLSLLFKGDRQKAFLGLCLLAAFYELTAVAQNERFMWIINYPWMGKGFGPSVISVIGLLLFLILEGEDRPAQRRGLWIGIFLDNVAGVMVASSCAEITLMFLGCWGLSYIIRKKDFSVIWKLILSCLPSLALMALHFI